MKKRKNSHKKYWVASIFQARKDHGFFRTVLPKVLEDLRFHNYIHTSATQLENLVLLIGLEIFKEYHLQMLLIREPTNVA